MKGTEFRKNLVGVITISLSFALGMTLYNAFLIADMEANPPTQAHPYDKRPDDKCVGTWRCRKR